MRSGNGRHRRPRQAPALLVTAGVTSAGIALPLLGATGAQAAGADTWDRVAECASGGVWSADQGDRASGGLGISLADWVRHGGEVYASSPDLASRSQQIAVAERILAERGPTVWGACATSSGLAEDRATDPGVDPGIPLPSQSGRGSDESTDSDSDSDSRGDQESPGSPDDSAADSDAEAGAPASPRPSDEVSESDTDPTQSVDPAAPEGTEDAEGSQDPRDSEDAEDAGDAQRPGEGTGKHRGPRDPEDAAAERERQRSQADRQRGREGDTADRAERPDRYQVRSGDSLSAIAARYDLPGGWPALHSGNETVIGEDPDLILPGQLLDLESGQPHAR